MKFTQQITPKISFNFSSIKKYKFRPIKFRLPSRGTRQDFVHNGTFHEAVGLVMSIAQLFGVMPVSGLRAPSAKYLRFKICSIRFWLSIFYIVTTAWVLGMQIAWIFGSKVEFGKLVSVFFDLTNWLSIVCFLELAAKWPKLMQHWYEVEKILPKMETELKRQRMSYEMKIVSFAILFGSMGEHLLSVIVGTYTANNCPAIRDPIKAFYISSYPYIFTKIEYSGYLGSFVKFLNISASFSWSYTDLFVILVSIGLASKFRHINEHLAEFKGKFVNSNFWSEYRLYYREVSNLVSTVDTALSKIILISISNNLFFICVQLLRSLDKKETFAHTFYFWVSLMYLIARTLAVSLYSASINDESKEPMEIFRAVPRSGWCDEVARFNEEVANDCVALSGAKFFNLTRQLVLSVTGTIVTYELVLIQFHQDDVISDYDPCHSKNATARELVFGKANP